MTATADSFDLSLCQPLRRSGGATGRFLLTGLILVSGSPLLYDKAAVAVLLGLVAVAAFSPGLLSVQVFALRYCSLAVIVAAQPIEHDADIVLGREVPPGLRPGVFYHLLSWGPHRRFFQGVLGLHLYSFVTTTKPQHSANLRHWC